ncbi:hypothetical protein [uncultured Cedecea sp.]|uniref:hypothetical protein n=1 Tax=uncultured Cedecea sp. TaxID=988762 RepID=UPI002633CD1D|nr:hypothetical protein [uncultured Cedecea sp.]
MIRAFLISGFFLLSGCSSLFESESERLERCQNKGITRDMCYQQDRADARAVLNRQSRVKSQHEKEVLSKIGIEE